MKILFIAAIIVLNCMTSSGQQPKKSPKFIYSKDNLESAVAKPIHFTSTAQFEELTVNTTFLTFEIIFDELDNMVTVIDPDNGQVFFKYQVQYAKTTKDNESTIQWYKLYQSPKFNFFKICRYNQPLKIKSKMYNYCLIFSRYSGNTRMNDFGFLANKTN